MLRSLFLVLSVSLLSACSSNDTKKDYAQMEQVLPNNGDKGSINYVEVEINPNFPMERKITYLGFTDTVNKNGSYIIATGESFYQSDSFCLLKNGKIIGYDELPIYIKYSSKLHQYSPNFSKEINLEDQEYCAEQLNKFVRDIQ